MKLLVAGPTIPVGKWGFMDLRDAARRELAREIAECKKMASIVYAADTAIGRIIEEFCGQYGIPAFPQMAFGKMPTEQFGPLTDRARQLIAERNQRMLAQPGIAKMLLFISTNECADFIAAAHRAKGIEVKRVMA